MLYIVIVIHNMQKEVDMFCRPELRDVGKVHVELFCQVRDNISF